MHKGSAAATAASCLQPAMILLAKRESKTEMSNLSKAP